MLFLGLQYQADKDTWSAIEASHYNAEEIVLLKLPMALPYPVNEGQYEPMHENFEHAGEFYKGIKQKLQNDTLYIYCVKDNTQKHIVKDMNDYAKVINDLPAKSKSEQSLLSKLIKEYEPIQQINLASQYGIELTFFSCEKHFNLLETSSSVLSPPPEKLFA